MGIKYGRVEEGREFRFRRDLYSQASTFPLVLKGDFTVISETFLQANLGMEKLNLTPQEHAFTNQKKCTTTQNKHKKTKAKFSRLLRHLAWKRSGSIVKGKDK